VIYKDFYNLLRNVIQETGEDTEYDKGTFLDIYGDKTTSEIYDDLINNASSLDGIDSDTKAELIKFFSVFVNKSISKKESLNLTDLRDNLNFKLKNILFKGVPGTGKSHKIGEIINDKNKLNLSDKPENVLRINIHSASSNADLMLGIAITTENEQVSYKEKQGLIFKHIQKACFSPYEPFVLVLEEIQENSLNELIGDLIYLIEDNKRAKIYNIKDFEKEEYDYQTLVEEYISKLNAHFVEIPNLVSIDEKNRKMIMPDNLYIFCTSNYRDDKKVIEDNLLRRFDVIEVYPQYKKTLEVYFKSQKVSDFLEALNTSISDTFDTNEIHPDRFLIGHSNWLKINDSSTFKEKEFYKVLLKVVIEFKEIREIDFKQGIDEIFKNKEFVKYLDTVESEKNWVKIAFKAINKENLNYQLLVSLLQDKVYKDILELK